MRESVAAMDTLSLASPSAAAKRPAEVSPDASPDKAAESAAASGAIRQDHEVDEARGIRALRHAPKMKKKLQGVFVRRSTARRGARAASSRPVGFSAGVFTLLPVTSRACSCGGEHAHTLAHTLACSSGLAGGVAMLVSTLACTPMRDRPRYAHG